MSIVEAVDTLRIEMLPIGGEMGHDILEGNAAVRTN